MAANYDRTADIWAFDCFPKAGEPGSGMRPRGRRMGAARPARSRPVRNRDTVISLIVVAAALLDSEVRGRPFTFEQLVKRMRELLDRSLVLDVADVRAALPGMGYCLAKARGGWRWKSVS
jgi:hypothetical protein